MTGVPPAITVRRSRFCYLAAYGQWEDGPMPPCSGRLRRCHLISRWELKQTEAYRSGQLNLWDPRLWVWGCGGLGFGNGGHHGAFDSSRRLRLARSAIPEATEAFARAIGLEWWLSREYGELNVRA